MSRDRTFLISSVVVFMVSLDATVVAAAFPTLRASFPNATPAALSWSLNAYTIVFAALLVPMGRMADQRGRRQVFLGGLTVFTVASAACSLAWSPFSLAVFRAAQAVGAAAVTPASLALILAATPPEGRTRAVSGWTAVGALAAALGPALGSFILELASWPAIFALNVPVGVITWWTARERLAADEPLASRAAPDLGASVVLAGAVAAMAAGIVRAGEDVGGRFSGIALAGGGLIVLGILALRQGRARETAYDGAFQRASLAAFVFGGAMGLMFLSFYLFMTGVWQYGQSRAGAVATLGPLVAIVVIIGTASLANRRGPRRLILAGGLAYAGSHLWYAARLTAEPDYLGLWLPGQLMGALGIGLVLPNLTGVALARLREAELAEGNAILATARQLGGAVGVAIAVALVGDVSADLASYRIVYLLLAAAGLAVSLLAVIPSAERGSSRGSRGA